MARNKFPEETINLILEKSLKLFLDKGYDNTSIQDIINQLGGLSKGAIYHHFKSKEEIFTAVCNKLERDNTNYYDKIRDDNSLNGRAKLRVMIQSAYLNPSSDAILSIAPKLMNEPKFMMNLLIEMYRIVVPKYIQPIIEEGIRDGSLQTNYPKEVGEVLITLTNVWINPIFTKLSPNDLRNKMDFIDLLLTNVGLDLFDEEIKLGYIKYYEFLNF